QTGVNIGGIVGAATLPTLALALSWHYGFLAIGFISIVVGIVSFILYREPPHSVELNTSPTVNSASSGASVWEVFRGREIWLVSLAGASMVFVEFSVLAHFVLYLGEVMLIGVVAAGLFLATSEAAGAFGKPVSGFISDYFFRGDRKKVYILMCGLTFAMCLLLSFLERGSPFWIIGPICFVLGLAAIGWGGLHLTLVGEIAGKELAGIVTGVSTVILVSGHVIGPPTFGYIVDVTGSYEVAWRLLAILAAVAMVLLFFVREERKRI
ncbi:MAG: MFS transporter, partial [Dehalococcoidales bacterium]